MYVAGRPDAEDRRELAVFGAAIRNKVESTETYKTLVLPGNLRGQQGSLHLLYALPFRMSGQGQEHRTSGDDGDKETENSVRHEKG